MGASKRAILFLAFGCMRGDEIPTYLVVWMGLMLYLGVCAYFVFFATDWTDGLAIRIDILISVFLLLFWDLKGDN